MLRFINFCLFFGLVALAYVIYHVKYEAHGLDDQIAALNKQIDDEHETIAELRAEWSLLNRPARIERLAEKYLNLAPAAPRQLVTMDTVSPRNLEPLAPTPAEATSSRGVQAATPGPAVPARHPVRAAAE